MKLISDNVLMQKVKDGDIDKLGLLFERYHRQLFGFFCNMTNNRTRSEDLVQTVFERILKYRYAFRGEGKFKTWMYYIARNVLIDERKKSKLLNHSEDINEYENALRDEFGTEQTLKKEEEMKQLRHALAKLSPEKKELLLLSRFEGLKYKEIGVIMDCTEGTVKLRMFRALKELKKIYIALEN